MGFLPTRKREEPFFFTKKRAIVVAPFFLQRPPAARVTVAQPFSSVEMLGWETSDRATIEILTRLFDFYRTISSSLVAVYDADVEVKQCTDAAMLASELAKAAAPLEAGVKAAALDGQFMELLASPTKKVKLSAQIREA